MIIVGGRRVEGRAGSHGVGRQGGGAAGGAADDRARHHAAGRSRPAAGGRYAEVAAWMRQGGESVLATAAERARRERPGISVKTVLLPGDPRGALIDAAREAQLLVVGSHGLGAVRGLLVGSVAHGVAEPGHLRRRRRPRAARTAARRGRG
ncbi:universal stress protein [Nonomuraea ferruginea]